MTEEEREGEIPPTNCSNPFGEPGDTYEKESDNGRRIEIYKCSPLGNWVYDGSRIKD